ncbi:MAG: YitT family protein [Oscillospiraceae bacterium]|nr:YitT family protein [Oscillospiraceae bacterium]
MQNKIVKNIVKYLAIMVGSLVYAAGFQFFLYPNAIVSGGVTGVSMIINAFTGFPVGLMIILLNVPLFLASWRHFGTDFMFASLAGMAISSVFVDMLAATGTVLTDEPMLAAIIGGVVKGAGLGAIYYVGATTGGIDIVAKMLRQRFAQINFGTMILIMDTVIIIVYAAVLGNYESAMYSVIAMFVVSKVIDLVLYGIDNSALCYIISENSEELTQSIISGPMKRGVTILEGTGAFSHRQKHVIMCVIKRTQIAEMRRLVRDVDETAFFIVTDAKNVFGKGFESITELR